MPVSPSRVAAGFILQCRNTLSGLFHSDHRARRAQTWNVNLLRWLGGVGGGSTHAGTPSAAFFIPISVLSALRDAIERFLRPRPSSLSPPPTVPHSPGVNTGVAGAKPMRGESEGCPLRTPYFLSRREAASPLIPLIPREPGRQRSPGSPRAFFSTFTR